MRPRRQDALFATHGPAVDGVPSGLNNFNWGTTDKYSIRDRARWILVPSRDPFNSASHEDTVRLERAHSSGPALTWPGPSAPPLLPSPPLLFPAALRRRYSTGGTGPPSIALSLLPGFLKGTATATSSSPPSKCQGSSPVGRLVCHAVSSIREE